jgi:hypothetical protein
MAIASLQGSLFNDYIVLEIRSQDGVAIAPEDIQNGIDAAQVALNQAGVSAYAACGTAKLLDLELHDAFECRDDDVMDYYIGLGKLGNAWLLARDTALEAACKNEPDAMYQYRMYVEWDGREPGEWDDAWEYFKKGGDTEQFKYTYPE